MKKVIIVAFLIFIISLTSQAQKVYSAENLEKASQEELDLYLEKALKNKKTGKKLTNVSVISIGATILYAFVDPFNHELGALIPFGIAVYAGVPAIAVGIPMQIVNKKRIERINEIKKTAYKGFKFDLLPCTQYNLATQNYSPCIKLRITF
ncbi:MAG: hypothetical protein HQ541_15380 [Mariniphaga sp.]|nr:hypothetical protein [Mariniphaga sp.]